MFLKRLIYGTKILSLIEVFIRHHPCICTCKYTYTHTTQFKYTLKKLTFKLLLLSQANDHNALTLND